MAKKKKSHYVLVRVSADRHIPAAHVRREIKTRVNEACVHTHDEEAVKILSVAPAPKMARQEEIIRRRRKTNLAYLANTY
jgi:hypothetical protein